MILGPISGPSVVLFEMVAGQRPFKGEQLEAVSVGILQGQPAPLTGSRAGVPAELERVVNRALKKPAADRYQTIADLLSELWGVRRTLESGATAVTAAEKSVPSIAVLPFSNMSADPEQEYFSDGLTEEIIADLSKIHALRVISRTSAMQLKGTRKTLKTIGRELNVRYLLEGSVRKAGNNLRITAQLIDATEDVQLWAEKYSGTLEDVFDIQERVARAIVGALQVKLSPGEEGRIAERPLDDVHLHPFRIGRKFVVTDKRGTGRRSVKEMLPHLTFLAFSTLALGWGSNQVCRPMTLRVRVGIGLAAAALATFPAWHVEAVAQSDVIRTEALIGLARVERDAGRYQTPRRKLPSRRHACRGRSGAFTSGGEPGRDVGPADKAQRALALEAAGRHQAARMAWADLAEDIWSGRSEWVESRFRRWLLHSPPCRHRWSPRSIPFGSRTKCRTSGSAGRGVGQRRSGRSRPRGRGSPVGRTHAV